jgi:signal transduction histidine kinase
MVSDLLDFTQARLRPGLPATKRAADVHQIGKQVIEELQVTWPDRRLRLDSSGDGTGNWDPDRIAQLMTNLVSNALKYGKRDTEVVLRTTGATDHVRVEVHNEGNPIAPETIPSLFEPMQRGVEPKADRSVGLGLFIAKDIVRAHSGSIEVTSSASEGTTFSVRLPREF